MPSAVAFSPSHITGMFRIHKNSSTGAGFCLGKGMITSVSAEKLRKKSKGKRQKATPRWRVFINNNEAKHGKDAVVSFWVLRKFRELAGDFSATVQHKTEFPIGYGCGMSAAAGLSLSLALNKALRTGLSREQCVKLSHDADVACGTGLGGVDAEALGGILFRVKPDAKQVRKLKPCEERRALSVVIAFFDSIKTASVIRSASWKAKINRAGAKYLNEFGQEPSISRLVTLSRAFSLETGLADWCRPVLASDQNACMAMLGRTIFVFTKKPAEVVENYKKLGARKVLIAKIGEKGAHVL